MTNICPGCEHRHVFIHTVQEMWTWKRTTELIETCRIGAAPMEGGKTQPVESCRDFKRAWRPADHRRIVA